MMLSAHPSRLASQIELFSTLLFSPKYKPSSCQLLRDEIIFNYGNTSPRQNFLIQRLANPGNSDSFLIIYYSDALKYPFYLQETPTNEILCIIDMNIRNYKSLFIQTLSIKRLAIACPSLVARRNRNHDYHSSKYTCYIKGN